MVLLYSVGSLVKAIGFVLVAATQLAAVTVELINAFTALVVGADIIGRICELLDQRWEVNAGWYWWWQLNWWQQLSCGRLVVAASIGFSAVTLDLQRWWRWQLRWSYLVVI